jgi:hypothetical protein
MCSDSACYGAPSCINQAAINAAGGGYGCSKTLCYSGCGTSACDSMCSSTCSGLATTVFYLIYILIIVFNNLRDLVSQVFFVKV